MYTLIKRAAHCMAAAALLFSGSVYAQTNVALNKATNASSALSPSAAAVDGNANSRWESTHGIENSWIQVDLGVDINLTSTVIDWEAANPATYLVLGSLDGTTWATLATRTGGAFGNRSDTVPLSGKYRYLRINATQRSAGNNWGYSIWEWKVFGSPASSSASSKSSQGSSSLSSSKTSSSASIISSSRSSLSSSPSSISSSSASSISSKSSLSSSIKSSSSSTSSATATSVLIQAEDFTSYLDLTTGNTGGVYRTTENVDIEATTDSGAGFNVGWIQQGEWLEYKVTLAAGTYNVNLRVASSATAGKYSVLIDGNSVGSANVGNTGGWQSWQTQKAASVTLNASGIHTVRVLADGPDFNFNWIQFEVSNAQSSSSTSVASSSSKSSSSSSDRNHYDAPRAITAPIIDGVADAVWDAAPWAPIDVYWLGAQHPSAQDFSGRYKAMWNAGNLFLLFDITDDVLFDNWANPLEHYWDDDSVEIFLDENKNGGNHQFNTSAWAYHVSTLGDVVDFTNSTTAKLLNNHITMRKVSVGTKHLWEMSVRVYGENYDDAITNTPLVLFAGKQMGFSACYNDNDSSAQRESMIGSVDTQGHKSDQGYINASVFGSMTLIEAVPQ